MDIDTEFIKSYCNPQSGDCASVATALQQVYGGTIVCLYDPTEEALPTHVLVEKDGRFFDGTGVKPIQDFVEVHLVLNGPLDSITQPESYITYTEPPSYMVNDTLVNDLVARLA